MNTTVVPIDDIEFVKELYPRLREDNAAIERYRAALEKLPPIAVARGRVLVDGFHRWQAHKRERAPEITVEDLGNLTDVEIRRESIVRNAAHGHQLSAQDKRRLAGMLWRDLAESDNGTRKTEIATMLSISERSVEVWTKDARVAEKQEQQEHAWDLWLNCLSDVEIGKALGVSDKTARDLRSEFAKTCAFSEPPASRQHFDVWQFPSADGDSSYFGRMPPQVVENVLWLYTSPGDTVIDPFAGGGTTIDVAKQMGRRVWASDLHPATPTLPIHQHDILAGWPLTAPKKAELVILDPPYWQQAKGRYSEAPTDLGNMPLDEFRAAWANVVKTVFGHTRLLAFVISPTQTDDGVIDHALEMHAACIAAGWRPVRRIIVPYQTQQATGQQVEWARENRRLLKLYRDLLIYEAAK